MGSYGVLHHVVNASSMTAEYFFLNVVRTIVQEWSTVAKRIAACHGLIIITFSPDMNETKQKPHPIPLDTRHFYVGACN